MKLEFNEDELILLFTSLSIFLDLNDGDLTDSAVAETKELLSKLTKAI